jgi:glycyl-tRNA synthetase beta subunit
MCPTFWKFMRNYNNDNIVKFLFKFLSIFQTQEKINYYIAVLDRQLLQHMCEALHILVSSTNEVLHFFTSTHWRVSNLLPKKKKKKKKKKNPVLCNNKKALETVEETASIFRSERSFVSYSWWHQVLPKLSFLSTRLHTATSQTTAIFENNKFKQN